MKVTTKELRIQPGKIIDQVIHGEEVTVTFRGKALARIVPISESAKPDDDRQESIFGMWRDRDSTSSVEEVVRNMREGRQF